MAISLVIIEDFFHIELMQLPLSNHDELEIRPFVDVVAVEDGVSAAEHHLLGEDECACCIVGFLIKFTHNIPDASIKGGPEVKLFVRRSDELEEFRPNARFCWPRATLQWLESDS